MNETKLVDAATAHEWIKNGQAVLVDVREPDEFAAEHIACAVSLPLSQLDVGLKDLSFSEGKLIFHCQRGKRGENACQLVPMQQFPKAEIYNLIGGMDAWKEANLPTMGRGNTAKISLMRQVQIVVGALIAACVVWGFSGQELGFVLAGLFGTALMIAGLTGWCGMAILLSKMPWNR